MATILLVEDDAPVRRVLRHMLLGHGHRVIDAASAPEALAAAEAEAGPINLVIADVVMPQSNCDELVDRLRAARPGLKALLISGYPEETLQEHGVDPHKRPSFLQKPFTVEQLHAKIREIVEASGSRARSA
jgi:CheY-like chemotaxis protein